MMLGEMGITGIPEQGACYIHQEERLDLEMKRNISDFKHLNVQFKKARKSGQKRNRVNSKFDESALKRRP